MLSIASSPNTCRPQELRPALCNNTSYTYYDHGGLWTQATARSITTTHTYDALQRPLTKTYSDGTPSVTYEYYLAGGTNSPQVGRLKSVANSAGSTTYTYDALGRILTNTQAVTGNGSYLFQYSHLLNGNVSTVTYPSGRVLTYVQDDAGRVTSLTGVKGAESATYVSGATYAPHGAILSMPIESGARTERWCYNNRMQPVAKGSAL